MNLLYFTGKLKNFIKLNFRSTSKIYKVINKLYLKFGFPFEKFILKRKKTNGFETESSLHMCSLFPKRTIDTVINLYKPKTWLDVGCGTAISLKYVNKLGLDAIGIENSDLAIKQSGIGALIKKLDLSIPVNLFRQFDLVWCYEVAEHLPEQYAEIFLNTLILHGKTIILSAAKPGQGGDGHVNEQPASYWIEKMKKRKFIVDEDATNIVHALNELYSANVYCFKKM